MKKSEKAQGGGTKEEQDVCGSGLSVALDSVGKGGCAGEETVPGAEDERRDYPGRFVGPTDSAEVRSRVRSARYGKTLNNRLTSLRFLPCFWSTRGYTCVRAAIARHRTKYRVHH